MALFSRPGSELARNFHSYIADRPSLQNIGLASYTKNSMQKFGKERRNGQDVEVADIKEYFGGTIPRSDLLGTSATLSILRFDKGNKRYVMCTSSGSGEDNLWYTPSGNFGGGLSQYQDRFDLYQKGFITTDLEKYQISYVWSKIQTSMSGCITFQANYTVLSCPDSGVIRLYFQSAGKSNGDRSVANKGAPIVAATPRRPTGPQYSHASTKESAPGVYIPAREGGDNNPENTIAAKFKMHYDPATGQWESGTTQMMFRLLTDIDGVPLKDLPPDVDTVGIDEFYQGGLSSSFTVGSGMAVSTENGNPYLFGPNTNSCANNAPKEKVILVNRTPRSYTKGEIVIASLINGEWIPMGFGLPKTVSKKVDIQWSQIQKYIVNSAVFFRNASDTDYVTPDDYKNHVRYKFYSSLAGLSNSAMLTSSGNDLNKIALLNLDAQPLESYTLNDNGTIKFTTTTISSLPNYNKYINMVPSTGYFQFFDADTINASFGGNNNNNSKLKKTNIAQMPQDVPDVGEVYAENVPSSWGLYFRDGYTSASVSRLKSNTTATSAFAVNGAGSKIIYAPSTLNFADTTSLDLSDSNFYHLPAQIALNSSGNQTMFMELLWFKQNQAGSYANNLINFFKDPLKGDYLYKNNNTTIFGLSPVNSTSVQFTPLSLELALCSTIIPADHAIKAINGGYEDLRINLAYQNWTKDAFGKAWERLGGSRGQPFIIDTTNNIQTWVPFGKILIRNGQIVNPARKDTKPDGGPGILPQDNGDEISNVVGILAAKATVNLPAGGQLELRTDNHFGLNAYGVVGGGGGFLSFIPTMFGLVPGADGRSEIKKYDFVQWGSSSSDGDIKAFGTTALYCAIEDHCPSSIYDGRYLTSLQFHGNSVDLAGQPIDVEIPATGTGTTKVPLTVGTVIDSTYAQTITTIKNPIRRNMLLTGGGFYYIKRVLGANTAASAIEIKDIDPAHPATGYVDGDLVLFQGSKPATFKVTQTDANGKITKIEIDDSLGTDAYGEFTGNPFKSAPIEAYPKSQNGRGAKILLKSGKIIEKVMLDSINNYNIQVLTPSDNDGGGDSYGYVRSSKSVTYNLAQNSNGKYDILFFFVNDIANYPENSAGANGQMETMPFAQYVNLNISAN